MLTDEDLRLIESFILDEIQRAQSERGLTDVALADLARVSVDDLFQARRGDLPEGRFDVFWRIVCALECSVDVAMDAALHASTIAECGLEGGPATLRS